MICSDLGAGKTTFSRGFVRKLAGSPTMRVTSPSYLLDNCYKLEPCAVHHMDLYRLPPGKDLSFLGIPEIYATSHALSTTMLWEFVVDTHENRCMLSSQVFV